MNCYKIYNLNLKSKIRKKIYNWNFIAKVNLTQKNMNILKNIEFLISGIDFDNQSIYQQKEFIIKNLSSKLNHYIVNLIELIL